MVDSLTDPRAYLQKRVALFTGVTFVFFALLLALDFATPAEGEPLISSTRIASMVVLVTHGAVWAITRRGERSVALCRGLELLAMLAAMAVFATLPLVPPIPGVGGVMAMFTPVPMAVLVLLRAAIIPSPAWLSAALTLAWGALMTASSALGWEGVEIGMVNRLLEDGIEPWMVPVSLGVLTTFAFAFVAAVVSHVVHGLQSKVREAMQLGQYTLEAKIGEGGMGVVYRARDRLLRRPTAVKLLPPRKAGEEAIARFEREVHHTSRLTHPNTVAIYDFGRTADGVFYYAMEYLDGISLQDLVDEHGPLPPGRVIALLAQAAEALAEAHEAGLVHRDVKPDNIMLCERGGVADVVKVLDFGLVKDVGAPDEVALSRDDALQGTPLYMAPEALTDPAAVDGRSDLYALGAVAYFLLAGRHVFEGKLVEVLGHHLHTAPTPPSELGAEVEPALEAIVLRCLEKAPAARPATAGELRRALLACPAAGAWGREEATAWWDRQRDALRARRQRTLEPAELTVAPRSR